VAKGLAPALLIALPRGRWESFPTHSYRLFPTSDAGATVSSSLSRPLIRGTEAVQYLTIVPGPLKMSASVTYI
jgi:hypothetical protein